MFVMREKKRKCSVLMWLKDEFELCLCEKMSLNCVLFEKMSLF
jgi:hypothetical protein